MKCSYKRCSTEHILNIITQTHHQRTLIVFVAGIEEIVYDFDQNRVLWSIQIPEKYRCSEIELAMKLR